MFGFVKQIFVSAIVIFGCNLSNVNPLKRVLVNNVNPLKFVSVSNQKCKVRPEIINITSNELLFYPYSIKMGKCKGSCNNVNDQYAKTCISDVVKNINLKVFKLMSRKNETRYIKLHEACHYKCRLDASVCNNKQRWNEGWK